MVRTGPPFAVPRLEDFEELCFQKKKKKLIVLCFCFSERKLLSFVCLKVGIGSDNWAVD